MFRTYLPNASAFTRMSSASTSRNTNLQVPKGVMLSFSIKMTVLVCFQWSVTERSQAGVFRSKLWLSDILVTVKATSHMKDTDSGLRDFVLFVSIDVFWCRGVVITTLISGQDTWIQEGNLFPDSFKQMDFCARRLVVVVVVVEGAERVVVVVVVV
ncbi:hypothetical protein E2C01_014221 [Portunus trituberculatus]|uniref:Uncharacterized protein n=1 Tax=Portunus trituberculatus TaxID=210409 RepID=A0A5B7DJA5_PORTR|nr:hypothetical protein [Portunus trituberculatus]